MPIFDADNPTGHHPKRPATYPPAMNDDDYIDLDLTTSGLEPGIHQWRVTYAKAGRSQKGDRKIELKFQRVDNSSISMRDTVMLEGGGREIGMRKLKAFLAPDFKGALNVPDLIGCQVWAETQIHTYKDSQQLQVNIQGLKHAGYNRHEDRPPTVPAPDTDDPPF